MVAALHRMNVNVLFQLASQEDFQNFNYISGVIKPSTFSTFFSQDNTVSCKRQKAFLHYATTLFHLLGDNMTLARKEANVVLTIKKALAPATKAENDNDALQFSSASYTLVPSGVPVTLAYLQSLAPAFVWKQYFLALPLLEVQHIRLMDLHYFRVLNHVLTSLPLQDLKIYLRYQLAATYAPYLSEPFIRADDRYLSAVTDNYSYTPRKKRVLEEENVDLKFALGKLYVDKTLSSEKEKTVRSLFSHIREVFKNSIIQHSWLSNQTKQAALQKLNRMQLSIGYPVKMLDYSSLVIDRGAYAANVRRAYEFLMTYDFSLIGKPDNTIDRYAYPQYTISRNSLTSNRIYIPAGILQPPFFNPRENLAEKYSHLGFILAHEMGHAFDNICVHYDSQGALKNTWMEADLKKLYGIMTCLLNQYSRFTFEGKPINGKMALSEAMANLSGIVVASRAFQSDAHYKNVPIRDGFSPLQQFYLAFAHGFAQNVTPETTHEQIESDHLPWMYEVNGTLANIPEFQRVFHIAVPSPMVNPQRCLLWH
jgi:putative endopeptidase